VGETLCVQERDGSAQGLICQIIEFRMVTYPALVQEQLRLVLDHVDSQTVSNAPLRSCKCAGQPATARHGVVAGTQPQNRHR
jgi:hypothetical protein